MKGLFASSHSTQLAAAMPKTAGVVPRTGTVRIRKLGTICTHPAFLTHPVMCLEPFHFMGNVSRACLELVGLVAELLNGDQGTPGLLGREHDRDALGNIVARAQEVPDFPGERVDGSFADIGDPDPTRVGLRT